MISRSEYEMEGTSNMFYDDFSMLFDDDMITDNIEIRKTYIARDMLEYVKMKYPDTGDEEINKTFNHLYDKVLAAHQKISMMMFAEYNFHKVKADFESTQNMDVPVLYGMGKTRIMFYLECMIIFARNALDVAATVYSDLIFNQRMDSFNDLSKKIIKSDNPLLQELKRFFEDNREVEVSAFRLLCGSKKGRALRDIIIHQANVHLEYFEYKENSERERLFLMLKDDMAPIDLDWFVSTFIDEVEEIFDATTSCCKKLLESRV